MPITHDPETGYGFTFGKLSYVGYATREQAAEALYDLERGTLPAPSADEQTIIDWILNNADMSPEERIIEAVERAANKPSTFTDAVLEYTGDTTKEVISLLEDICQDDGPVTRTHEYMSDGSGGEWDRYTCGDISLCIEGLDGGTLNLFDTTNDLGYKEVAELLDLRTILNDPRVVAGLEAIYNAE